MIIVCFAVMMAWAAAEWMFFGEVARIWRNPELPRRDKAQAVATAVADILFICLFIMWVFCWGADGNGYCFDFSKYHESMEHQSFVIGFAIAPLFGVVIGTVMFFLGIVNFGAAIGSWPWPIMDADVFGNATILGSALLLFSSIYLLAGASERSKIMWHAPGRSKWQAVLVFFATYWPLMLELFFIDTGVIR